VLSWEGEDSEMGMAGILVLFPQQTPLEPRHLICSCSLRNVLMVICDSNYDAAIYNSCFASKMLSNKRQIFNILKMCYKMYKPAVV